MIQYVDGDKKVVITFGHQRGQLDSGMRVVLTSCTRKTYKTFATLDGPEFHEPTVETVLKAWVGEQATNLSKNDRRKQALAKMFAKHGPERGSRIRKHCWDLYHEGGQHGESN